ncbi:hypothetical protein ACO0LO_10680 [Undibacterium sp. TJN25]|uniref:hypothetical protein n=1 Tax=Undibacterium sp. TJN25 TaxID=3413056 RepID=UPI003BF07A2B
MAFGDESGNDRLRELRIAGVKVPADLFKALDLRFGHHKIRQPNAGNEYLTEGARMEHAPVAVQVF